MNLYKLINKIGTYWVVATDPTNAQEKLTDILRAKDYGFSDHRKVTEIHLVAEGITDFISGRFLIL